MAYIISIDRTGSPTMYVKYTQKGRIHRTSGKFPTTEYKHLARIWERWSDADIQLRDIRYYLGSEYLVKLVLL